MRIYLRGGVYWADLHVHGRRMRRSTGTNEKALALKQAQELEDKLKETVNPGGPRLDAFGARYIEWAWQSKPASAQQEAWRLKKILAWLNDQGVEFMAQITVYHVEQLKAKLRAEGFPQDPNKTKGETDPRPAVPASKATTNRYLQLLRGMINRAIDWEIYEGRNPVSKVKFFNEEGQVRPLTADELGKILEAARSISAKPLSPVQRVFYDLCVFALNTGMRKSEILQLRWADVREKEAFIRGKGDKARRVPLNAAAAAVVERQPRRTEFVFHVPNRDRNDVLRRTVQKVGELAGVEFTFHLFRHYFTTQALAVADFVTVSKILGHGRTMTSLLYSHSTKERARNAVDQLPGVPGTVRGNEPPTSRKEKRKRRSVGD